MDTLPNPKGYLFAPILVPSLHVLFTPLWLALDGKADLAVLAMTWQMVAWFALTAACLATISPALWVARRRIAAFPFKSFNKYHKLALAITAAALASMFLMGPYKAIRSVPATWLFAYVSAACFLSGLYTKQNSQR